MIGKKDGDDFNVGGNLNTIIGKGSSFEGTFTVNSTLRVDGKIKGNVTISDSLVIGKDGVIDGEVTVRNAIIGGKLSGKLTASGKVVLETNSVFNGELRTAKLAIDEGAIFEGNCAMGDSASASKGRENSKNSTRFFKKEESSKEVKVAE